MRLRAQVTCLRDIMFGFRGFTLDALDKSIQRRRGEAEARRMFRMQGVQ
jgi:hypothetical protein